MVPTVAFPSEIPSTLQDTVVLVVPETVAVRGTAPPRLMLVALGVRVNPMAPRAFDDGAGWEAALPPLQAIREEITPITRMPRRRT